MILTLYERDFVKNQNPEDVFPLKYFYFHYYKEHISYNGCFVNIIIMDTQGCGVRSQKSAGP